MSGKAVIPAKAGIQVLEFVVVAKYLDARLRGHDELRHSIQGQRGFSVEGELKPLRGPI
jgi:hypothetical protein